MSKSQIFLDLYIDEYLKNNPNENEADLRNRLNDAFADSNNENHKAEILPTSAESEQAPKGKSYTLEEIRLKHKGAYMSWTDELDLELTVMYNEGTTLWKWLSILDEQKVQLVQE